MTPYELEARNLLATMPEEVFENWMRERIQTAGWPPSGTRWYRLLAGFSIQEWARFQWSLEKTDVFAMPFSEDAMNIIKGLSEAHFSKVRNAYSEIENTEARMRRIYAHIKATRTLPGSIIAIDNGYWELVDGCHRVAMYAAWLRHPTLKNQIERLQSVWVARPNTVQGQSCAAQA